VKFLTSLILFFFITNSLEAQDQKPETFVITAKEDKTRFKELFESTQIGLEFLNKDSGNFDGLLPQSDFSALEEALKLNKFEDYLEKSKPVKIVVKKESENITLTYAIDPTHFLVTTLGKSILESQNEVNIKSNYQDLYENLEPQEKKLFVSADKVSKLDQKNAILQYEKLLKALPKLQDARNTNKQFSKTDLNKSIPNLDCLSVTGFDNYSGDSGRWCKAEDFATNSLVGKSRLISSGKISCVKDQGRRGTCASFAIAGAIESLAPSRNFSEQYIYFKAEVMSGSGRWTYGLHTSWALSDLKNQNANIPLEKAWVYNYSFDLDTDDGPSGSFMKYPNSCNRYEPTRDSQNSQNQCSDQAFQSINWSKNDFFQTFSYSEPELVTSSNRLKIRRVDDLWSLWGQDTTLSNVIETVNRRNSPRPVIASIALADSFYNPQPGRNKGYVLLKSDRKVVGHHAILIMGFIKNADLPEGTPANVSRGYFVVKNSWGVGFGDCGFLYISYNYMKKFGVGFQKIYTENL
jgi:C1A family cysteine protease